MEWLMKSKRLLLRPQEEFQWAERLHVYVLDALMRDSPWKSREIAFQGGTSLRLSWGSPRHSEDLDFLLSRQKSPSELTKIMQTVVKHVQERVMMDDPDLRVELREKLNRQDAMPVYDFLLSHPAWLKKVRVKSEFWRVDPSYLEQYPTAFRAPLLAGDLVSRVTNAVPAATLETAYADKLTAFATRPRLKLRDLFDLWWIGTQTQADLDSRTVKEQFLHNVAAYQTVRGLPPAEALLTFLETPAEVMLAQAEDGLKQWLPASLWEALYPDSVKEMVEYARTTVAELAARIDGPNVAPTPPTTTPTDGPAPS